MKLETRDIKRSVQENPGESHIKTPSHRSEQDTHNMQKKKEKKKRELLEGRQDISPSFLLGFKN